MMVGTNQWTGTPNINNVLCLIGVSGTVFSGTTGGTLRSTDTGATWEPVNSGMVNAWVWAVCATGDTILAGVDGAGVYRSIDNGAHWNPSNDGITNSSVVALASGTGYCIVSTAGGVFVSSDGGAHWKPRNDGLGGAAISSLAVSGSLFLAGGNYGVWSSTLNDTSWHMSNPGYRGINTCLLISGGTILAGSDGGGISRSTDVGQTWLLANTGLGNLNVQAMARTGSVIHVGTTGGAFRSTDDGKNWERTAYNRVEVMTAHDSIAVFGSSPTSFYAIPSYGTGWTWWSDGFPEYFGLTSMASNNRYTFVGARGTGVWRRPNNEFLLGVVDGEGSKETDFSLRENYPNPFNPTTTISYALPTAGNVRITVYDVLGREVSLLVNESQTAGEHKIVWNAEGQPSGVYFYRLAFTDADGIARQYLGKMVLLR